VKPRNDYVERLMMTLQIEALWKEVRKRRGSESLLARAQERIRANASLTRGEAAAFLSVSTRKIQRMEVAGTLRRCPNLGTVVRYAARDVLRLASAS
jgi:hypothetical protein